ncbi:carbonic anhydrase [Pelomyxa schiedti]|nr:carbonic anhydrase [Pelomyxa schiedti]
MATHAPATTGPTPAEVLQRLSEGNQRFVAGTPAAKDLVHRRQELASGQHPVAVIVTCSDSRVCPEYIFDQSLGDLFVIRTAGNVVDDVELGSIEYAVEHLHSHLIVVLGHTACGAVTAACTPHPPATTGTAATPAATAEHADHKVKKDKKDKKDKSKKHAEEEGHGHAEEAKLESILTLLHQIAIDSGNNVDTAIDLNAKAVAGIIMRNHVIAPLVTNHTVQVVPMKYNLATGMVLAVL